MRTDTKKALEAMAAAADRLAVTAERAKAHAAELEAATIELRAILDGPDPEFVANEERNRQARIDATLSEVRGEQK